MTMATLDDGVNLEDPEDEDEDDEEVDDPDESGDTEEGTEVGGGDGGEPDGAAASGANLSGIEQLQQLLKDPDVAQTFQDQIADYQARMAAEAASTQEAEAFQKMIDDEDWEGVGKAVVARREHEAVTSVVKDQVTKEMFTPVYQELLAQPEMQKLTAEDRETLHLSKYPTPAAHVAAITSYIAGKRYEAQLAEGIRKGVEEALTAEKNKGTSEKAKAPSLAGRTPASLGVSQPKLSSADLIRSGLRGIIDPTATDDDDV